MFEKVAAMLEHFRLSRKAVRPGCFVVLETFHSNADFMECG